MTGHAPLLDPGEVATHLDDDTLLLEYAMHDRDLIAFAVTRAGGLVRALPRRIRIQPLATAMSVFRRACETGSDDWETPAKPIEAALLAPFADLLAEHSRLMIVSSGVAHRLPFSALEVNGERLHRSHELSLLPSASALGVLRDGATDHGTLLALGDPADMRYTPAGDSRPRKWSPVPFAGAAAAYAAKLYEGSVTLLGPDAAECNLERESTRHGMMLLATHAEVTEDPLRAFLALAGTDGLELHELLGLDLSAMELVVLAACSTDGGSVTGGEEVIGLTRALFVAGAARAIVTLWDAKASSLPVMVRELFRRLRAGDPPARALACAQREIADMDHATATERFRELRDAARECGHGLPAGDPEPQDWSHPLHWAPWVLYGR
jgi:CHAT domain-containing protein